MSTGPNKGSEEPKPDPKPTPVPESTPDPESSFKLWAHEIASVAAKAAATRLGFTIVGSILAIVGGFVALVEFTFRPIEDRIKSIEETVGRLDTNANDRLISLNELAATHLEVMSGLRADVASINTTLKFLQLQDERREKVAANLQTQNNDMLRRLISIEEKLASPDRIDFESTPSLPHPKIFEHINLENWSIELEDDPKTNQNRLKVHRINAEPKIDSRAIDLPNISSRELYIRYYWSSKEYDREMRLLVSYAELLRTSLQLLVVQDKPKNDPLLNQMYDISKRLYEANILCEKNDATALVLSDNIDNIMVMKRVLKEIRSCRGEIEKNLYLLRSFIIANENLVLPINHDLLRGANILERINLNFEQTVDTDSLLRPISALWESFYRKNSLFYQE